MVGKHDPAKGLFTYPNAKIFGVNMERLLPGKNEMILIGICVGCVAIVAFLIVRIHSPNLCPAGCGSKLDTIEAHHGECGNCNTIVYKCISTRPAVSENPAFPEHRAHCDACGQWYYLCEQADRPVEEEERYRHRIVGKGTPDEHYACQPQDTLSVPVPDK